MDNPFLRLDTSIKDQVTLYVANFTVPDPPYAARESRWEAAKKRYCGESASARRYA